MAETSGDSETDRDAITHLAAEEQDIVLAAHSTP